MKEIEKFITLAFSRGFDRIKIINNDYTESVQILLHHPDRYESCGFSAPKLSDTIRQTIKGLKVRANGNINNSSVVPGLVSRL